jgi:hypothetical protein
MLILFNKYPLSLPAASSPCGRSCCVGYKVNQDISQIKYRPNTQTSLCITMFINCDIYNFKTFLLLVIDLQRDTLLTYVVNNVVFNLL